jgi:hypothetical protein
MALVDVRRAADRAVTVTSWLQSRHSFSFGDHYDPGNTHHAVLLVNNDDWVAAGGGFDTHPHRDMEIVTWVLQGALRHEDSAGNCGVSYPGLAQRMSAGRGILHSERNDSASEPVHFVQMWVASEELGIEPEYQQREFDVRGGLVPIASGMPQHRASAITIHNRHAALYGAHLESGEGVELPRAPYLHLFVARGDVMLESVGVLAEGDAVRFTGPSAYRLSATTPSDVLVWEMHADLAA